jgi:hypothetical protein
VIKFRIIAAGVALVLAACGCNGGPGRIATPDVDAATAAAQAIELFDKNADARLDANELAACQSLNAALPTYDGDKDGALTEAEIAAGIGRWAAAGLGAIPLPFQVTLDGKPLAGAQLKLTPAPFLGDAVKPALGESDATGGGTFTMAPEDRPANVPASLPVMQPGLYRVEITHPTVRIPAKYNAESTLGVESAAASQNPAGVSWALTTK